MKALLVLLLALAAMPARADGLTDLGLDDPVVTPPAAVRGDWTGPYVGLSYGRTSTSTSSESCRKVFEGVDYGPYACDDPVFDYYPGSKVVTTETSESSSDDVGAFIGYRHELGWLLVGGVELGVSSDRKTLEAQAGLDLGRVLAYGFAGAGELGDETGTIYGVGIDMKLGKGLLVGVKQTEGDLGGLTTFRVGFKF